MSVIVGNVYVLDKSEDPFSGPTYAIIDDIKKSTAGTTWVKYTFIHLCEKGSYERSSSGLNFSSEEQQFENIFREYSFERDCPKEEKIVLRKITNAIKELEI